MRAADFGGHIESRREAEHSRAASLFEDGNYKEAFHSYRVLAEQGSVSAELFLGWMYLKGLGTTQDPKAAFRSFEKAASSGSAAGQFYLARLYGLEGKYLDEKHWLEKATAQGYLPAIFHLGWMYELGLGVPQDEGKAYAFFEEAAGKGHLFARRKIALRMLKGKCGLLSIPKGLLMLIGVVLAGVKTGWKDMYDERIRI